jgi:cyclic pyranopterin phosphate synthase
MIVGCVLGQFCYNASGIKKTKGTLMTLTHFNEQGRAHMVDVGQKEETQREAIARGRVLMKSETLALIREGGIKKGDVLAVAQVAGIMAAKRTHELIPMCHPLMLTHVSITFELQPAADPNSLAAVDISALVRTTGKTGVEMEALTAVSVAGLTIYDMCKAVDRAMQLDRVRLVRKSGGKSGEIVLE